MRLTPPRTVVFVISLVLALLAFLDAVGVASIRVGSFDAEEIALVAYAILAAAVLFKGL